MADKSPPGESQWVNPANNRPPPALTLPPAGNSLAANGPAGSGTVLHLEIPIDLSAVRPRILEALHFLVQQEVSAEDISSCELALVEACNNAILYTPDRTTPVRVELVCLPDRISMHVIDHTHGFDWPTHIGLPDNEAEHGRGLFLIQAVMNDAFYLRSPRENRLCLNRLRKAQVLLSGPDTERPGEMEEKLALSRRVLNSMADELCQQVILSRRQQEELDSRLIAHELEI